MERLEIKPTCEHCKKKALPLIPRWLRFFRVEFTFHKDCVDHILKLECSNCCGGFKKRPIDPKHVFGKYPVSAKLVHKPVLAR